eukprot:364977-Chlamydomonas_euryale.AAC.3
MNAQGAPPATTQPRASAPAQDHGPHRSPPSRGTEGGHGVSQVRPDQEEEVRRCTCSVTRPTVARAIVYPG